MLLDRYMRTDKSRCGAMCLYPIKMPIRTKSRGKVYMTVPCGKCFECLEQRSEVWSYRCMLEATKHSESCFLTLTYNEVNLPEGGTLVKRDLQNFLKRLREKLRQEEIFIRFFACGEYGSERSRCHYHIIVFGWKPKDLVYFFTDKRGKKIYKSNTVSKLWGKGFITVGDLDFGSAKYCAKYLQKFDKKKDKRLAPFIQMSRNPGIGAGVPSVDVLKNDRLYYHGNWIKVPRFFLDNFEKDFSEEVNSLKEKRIDNSFLYEDDIVSKEEKLEKKRAKWREISKKFNKFFDLY